MITVSQQPFIQISNQQIYDKLCVIESDVAALKLAEAQRKAAADDRYRHKMLLYPTCATAAAGLAAGLAALLK